jgi:hypothetical protein
MHASRTQRETVQHLVAPSFAFARFFHPPPFRKEVSHYPTPLRIHLNIGVHH